MEAPVGTSTNGVQKSRLNRKLIYWAILITIFSSIVTFLFVSMEKKLMRRGLQPGNFFKNYTYKDTLVVDQYLAADEWGMNYYERPMPWLDGRKLNAQGFISPFDCDQRTVDSLRQAGDTIIAIFGDSFVEGVTDGDMSSSFIELLRSAHPQWAIFAFGIGGTNPANYALAAERYLKVLKPDLAVIVFCYNDIMHFDFPATPCIPILFTTNSGRLYSIVPSKVRGGKLKILKTAEETFQYYRDSCTLLTRSDFSARFFRQSRILTMLYRAIHYEHLNSPGADKNITYRYLHRIFTCTQNTGSRFAITFIPDPRNVDKITTIEKAHQKYGWVFNDLIPYVHFSTGKITRSDYISENNQHFNDSGNKKYSVFLDSIIHSSLGYN